MRAARVAQADTALPSSEELRRRALQRSMRRGAGVAKRRLWLRWFLWGLWRAVAVLMALAALLALGYGAWQAWRHTDQGAAVAAPAAAPPRVAPVPAPAAPPAAAAATAEPPPPAASAAEPPDRSTDLRLRLDEADMPAARPRASGPAAESR